MEPPTNDFIKHNKFINIAVNKITSADVQLILIIL